MNYIESSDLYMTGYPMRAELAAVQAAFGIPWQVAAGRAEPSYVDTSYVMADFRALDASKIGTSPKSTPASIVSSSSCPTAH